MTIKLRGASRALTAAIAFWVVGWCAAIVAQDVKSQWNGIFTVEQAARGEALYTEKCSTCHGGELKGTEMAPGLADDAFSAKWNDQALVDLFEQVLTTMPGNAPGSLSRQQTADLLAFVLQKANYPAGMQELPTAPEMLKTYKFLASKPGA